MPAIATIGFGEAAQAFVAGWRTTADIPAPITTYDIKIGGPERDAFLAICAGLDVRAAETPVDALSGSGIIFSLVTADSALEAAALAAGAIRPEALYFDCNSCSPATKQTAARAIEGAGGRYVDVAVMSPVYPARHRTPLLVSGPHAVAAETALLALGMKPHIAGPAIGQASSIKMLRSVMIKGLEALTAECVLAARRAGVEGAVLASLQASDPTMDWSARAAYNLERMAVHGQRRAAEMQEVAATLRELGIPDRMAAATVEWQRQIGSLEIKDLDKTLSGRIDRILEHFER